MTLSELRALCVDAFPLSSTRDALFNELSAFVAHLRRSGIDGEIWIDGSFLTRKIDPKDVDIVVFVKVPLGDLPPELERTLLWIGNGTARCDSRAALCYPLGHADRRENRESFRYWHRLFGAGRDGMEKGIALLDL